MFLLFFLQLGLGLCNNIIAFGAIRLVMGVCIGIAVPLILNLLAENLPLKFRSFTMSSVWISFTVGQVCLLILMLFIMPNLESSYVNMTLLITSTIFFIIFIFVAFALDDSARSLIVFGKTSEAFEFLEKLHSRALTESEKNRLLSEVNNSSNVKVESNLKEIFSSKLLYTTLLQMFLWVSSALTFYGPTLITTITLKRLGEERNLNNNQVIQESIAQNIVGLPFLFFTGLLTEIPYLGRNKGAAVGLSLGLFVLIISIFYSAHFAIVFGIGLSLQSNSFNICVIYVSEFYPTKIRDFAMGFMFFMTRVGGVLSQIIYESLSQNSNVFVPYWFTAGIVLICIVVSLIMPYETFGIPLDFDHVHKHKNDILETDADENTKLA